MNLRLPIYMSSPIGPEMRLRFRPNPFLISLKGNQLVPKQSTVTEPIHGSHSNQAFRWRENAISMTVKGFYDLRIH